MNFISAAQILIPALIKLPVTICDNDFCVLEAFEKEFCFFPTLQPLYTAEGLHAFFDKKDGKQIYLLSDELDTYAAILKCDTAWVILGPFVCSVWQGHDARLLLAKHGLQEDFLLAYKRYRCTLPLFEQTCIVHIAELLIENTTQNRLPCGLEAISMETQTIAAMDVRIAYKFEETNVINQRYADEIRFIEAMSQGDTMRAMHLFEKFCDDTAIYHFATNRISDWIASAAITRTWVRLASVKAGLPPVVIDSISQEYAQQMHHAVDEAKILDLQRRFIFDFCEAIQKHNRISHSPYVKRAIEYIDTHLSQDITIHTLCKLNNITEKHFARLFSQETGKTVKQYLTQVRCERAAQLLEDSQLQVQEISRYVGYADNNYFSKVFKSTMGMTPQEYRKKKTFYATT